MVHTSMMQDDASARDNTKMMYKTAMLMRNRFTEFTKEEMLTDTITISNTIEDVSIELYSLIHWIMVGFKKELQTEMQSRTVDQSSLTISQNIMYAVKTKRQVQHRPKQVMDTFQTHHALENPQVLWLAFTVRHDTRNKKLMDLLHMQIYCASYGRSLLLGQQLPTP